MVRVRVKVRASITSNNSGAGELTDMSWGDEPIMERLLMGPAIYDNLYFSKHS